MLWWDTPAWLGLAALVAIVILGYLGMSFVDLARTYWWPRR
jgi:hypothetical protein